MSHTGRADKSNYSIQKRVIALSLTLPYDKDPPTVSCKQMLISLVSTNIASKLLLPELLTGLGVIGLLATVPVPEATMNKDHSMPPRKNQIRTAGKRMEVYTKAIAFRVKCSTYKQFGFCIHTTDATHESATLLSGNYVRHQTLRSLVLVYCHYPLSVEKPRLLERRAVARVQFRHLWPLYKVRKETNVGITRRSNSQAPIQEAVSRFTGCFR